MRRLDTALVTGASRGLGAAIARELAARGYRLCLVARDGRQLEALAATLRAGHGATVEVCSADLLRPEAAAHCAAFAEARLGGVDVLINNAGAGHYKPLVEWTAQEIADCAALNLTAPMLLARAVLPGMIARRRGTVLHVASDLARRPLANMAPYAAAKFGLLGFSGSLLREAKSHGIHVTAVLPGIVDTGFGGGTPDSRDERWALRPAALATQIAELLELPQNVVVDEITIHPLHQADF